MPLGRAQFGAIGPWIAGIVAVAVLFPYLAWLDLSGGTSLPDLATIIANRAQMGLLVVALLVGHVGLAILVRDRARHVRSKREGAGPRSCASAGRCPRRAILFIFLRSFLLFAMALFALLTRRPENFIGSPLVVLSGLAVVIAAGDRIRIGHQYGSASSGARCWCCRRCCSRSRLVVQPWIWTVDLQVGRPAEAMGQFFADSFAATDRPAAGDRRGRSADGVARFTDGAKPAEPLRGNAAGVSARITRSRPRRPGRGGVVARDRQCRAAAAGGRCGSFPRSCPKCRRRFRGVSRAACR